MLFNQNGHTWSNMGGEGERGGRASDKIKCVTLKSSIIFSVELADLTESGTAPLVYCA